MQSLTGLKYGIKPCIQQAFQHIAEPSSAADPAIAVMSASLHLTLSICFSTADPGKISLNAIDCDSTIWTTLNIQPYELSFLQEGLQLA